MADSKLIPSLSKVSDVTSIRVGDKCHSIDVICQVVRFSPYDKSYKYLNCEVLNDEHSDNRHMFSFKLSNKFFDQAKDVQPGDIICIKRSVRYDKEKRASSGYVLKPSDINIQLDAWEKSSIDILYSINVEEVTKFEFLKLAKDGITVRGKVEYIPHKDGDEYLMMLADDLDTLLEIKLPELFDVKKNEDLQIKGNLCVKGKMVFLVATQWKNAGKEFEWQDLPKKVQAAAPHSVTENVVQQPTLPSVPGVIFSTQEVPIPKEKPPSSVDKNQSSSEKKK
uniref:Uncharacterized protein n=1 Tax=Panagrolaimus sp. ES5 TaxID=591445 RepID=A0AC34FZR4_9BILA